MLFQLFYKNILLTLCFIFYSKKCGTSNFENNKLADLEEDYCIDDGNDDDAEMADLTAQNLASHDSTEQSVSVSIFCLYFLQRIYCILNLFFIVFF